MAGSVILWALAPDLASQESKEKNALGIILYLLFSAC